MTKDRHPPPKPQKRKNGASIKLEGKTGEDFAIVQDQIEYLCPGVTTTKTDVLCHALHLAAGSVVANTKPEISE